MAHVVKLSPRPGSGGESGGPKPKGGKPKAATAAGFSFDSLPVSPPVLIGGGIGVLLLLVAGLWLAFGRGGGAGDTAGTATPSAIPGESAPISTAPNAGVSSAIPGDSATIPMQGAASAGGAGFTPGMAPASAGGGAGSGVPAGPNLVGGATGSAAVTGSGTVAAPAGAATQTVGPGAKSAGTSSSGQPINPNDPPDDARRR